MLPEVKHLLDAGEVVVGNLDYQVTATEFHADMHQAFEIGIVIDGTSERRFGRFEVTLGPGEVWLVPAWEPHGYRWIGRRNFRLVICFLPEFLGGETFDGVSWLSLFAASPPERPWTLGSEARGKTLTIARELGCEFSDAAA
jgi:hypothetical protein